ncbi:hypothetical protein GALMADRAFT_801795 [Galerina marginata CBS 339.88]|uniref:Uncharacterized protein n=1 Tax=Galerina marginata (strain CBS 339.88) TaxID=685588 RepID=A0A067STM5_GALM3|nr:hypothetical protein GALMADRAFT_801795 [Galerina marginata CBS 339.88]
MRADETCFRPGVHIYVVGRVGRVGCVEGAGIVGDGVIGSVRVVGSVRVWGIGVGCTRVVGGVRVIGGVRIIGTRSVRVVGGIAVFIIPQTEAIQNYSTFSVRIDQGSFLNKIRLTHTFT